MHPPLSPSPTCLELARLTRDQFRAKPVACPRPQFPPVPPPPPRDLLCPSHPELWFFNLELDALLLASRHTFHLGLALFNTHHQFLGYANTLKPQDPRNYAIFSSASKLRGYAAQSPSNPDAYALFDTQGRLTGFAVPNPA